MRPTQQPRPGGQFGPHGTGTIVSGTLTPTPIGLLTNETVVTLTAGQTYDAGSSPAYIFSGTGSDIINGGTTGQSTVDYRKLRGGVTLTAEGTSVQKGFGGSIGTDTLTNVGTIVGSANAVNVIDESAAPSGTALTANLLTNTVTIGATALTVYNFAFIKGPNAADTFIGDNGNDTFIGGAGSTFTTGTGHNTLTGGGSNDTFNFGGGHDTITNFSVTGGDAINSTTTLSTVKSVCGGSLLSFAGGGTVFLQGVSASAVTGIGTTHVT
jgi:hypothetical protein